MCLFGFTRDQVSNDQQWQKERVYALSQHPIPRASVYCDPWETRLERMALSRARKGNFTRKIREFTEVPSKKSVFDAEKIL